MPSHATCAPAQKRQPRPTVPEFFCLTEGVQSKILSPYSQPAASARRGDGADRGDECQPGGGWITGRKMASASETAWLIAVAVTSLSPATPSQITSSIRWR